MATAALVAAEIFGQGQFKIIDGEREAEEAAKWEGSGRGDLDAVAVAANAKHPLVERKAGRVELFQVRALPPRDFLTTLQAGTTRRATMGEIVEWIRSAVKDKKERLHGQCSDLHLILKTNDASVLAGQPVADAVAGDAALQKTMRAFKGVWLVEVFPGNVVCIWKAPPLKQP